MALDIVQLLNDSNETNGNRQADIIIFKNLQRDILQLNNSIASLQLYIYAINETLHAHIIDDAGWF